MKNISDKCKHDIVLIILLLLAAAVFYLVYRMVYAADGAYAVIEVNGTEYDKLSLDTDVSYLIPGVDGSNRIEIKDRQVRVVEADCPDKICIDHRAISKTGESIICLPHRVVVKITGAEEAEVDAIAN